MMEQADMHGFSLIPKVLILCPKAVINGWLKSIGEFGITNIDFTVINPQKWINMPKEGSYDVIIVDEAHGMKNASSKVFKRLMNIRREKTLILTGTPTDGKPQELLALSNLLSPTIIGEYWKIAKDPQYFVLDPQYKSIMYSKESTFEYFKKCFKPYMFILDKLDDVELPELKVKNYKVPMCKKQQQIYDDAVDMIYTNSKGLTKSIHSAGVQVAKLRSICSGFLTDEYDVTMEFKHNKIKAINYIYDKNIRNSSEHDPLIIFISYTREADNLINWCDSKGLTYRLLTGKSNNTPKYIQEIEAFEYDVLIVHYKSGGAGLNLIKSRHIVLYSLPLSSIDYAQSIKRIHGPGQTRTCTIHRLLVKSSDVASKNIDEKTLKKINKKLAESRLEV